MVYHIHGITLTWVIPYAWDTLYMVYLIHSIPYTWYTLYMVYFIHGIPSNINLLEEQNFSLKVTSSLAISLWMRSALVNILFPSEFKLK